MLAPLGLLTRCLGCEPLALGTIGFFLSVFSRCLGFLLAAPLLFGLRLRPLTLGLSPLLVPSGSFSLLLSVLARSLILRFLCFGLALPALSLGILFALASGSRFGLSALPFAVCILPALASGGRFGLSALPFFFGLFAPTLCFGSLPSSPLGLCLMCPCRHLPALAGLACFRDDRPRLRGGQTVEICLFQQSFFNVLQGRECIENFSLWSAGWLKPTDEFSDGLRSVRMALIPSVLGTPFRRRHE